MNIKVKDLQLLAQGLKRFRNVGYDDIKNAYSINKNCNKIDSELKEIDAVRINLLEKYSEKDKKGKPILEVNQGVSQYKVKDINKFEKEWNKFIETEIEVELWKIKPEVIAPHKPTPNELSALSPILEDLKTK